MIHQYTALKTVFSSIPAVVLLQAAPVPSEIGWAAQIKDIGTIGFLALACVVLAKFVLKKDLQVQQKDEQILAMTMTVTEALSVAAASNAELRKIMEESVKAKDRLAGSIELLEERIGQLECTRVLSSRPTK